MKRTQFLGSGISTAESVAEELRAIEEPAPITRERGINGRHIDLHLDIDAAFPELYINRDISDEMQAVEEALQNVFNRLAVDLRELDPGLGLRIKIQWKT